MARPDQATTTFEKKVAAIFDFATDLRTKLPNPQIPSADLLLADIGHQINNTKALAQRSPSKLAPELGKSLERIGRDLWNLCIRLRRDASRNIELDCRARLFALHILEIGRFAQRIAPRDEESDIVYLLELSMTVGRVCLQDQVLESCRTALQKTAELVDRLKALHSGSGLDERPTKCLMLEANYLTMRMALKEDRLDVAEHMYGKTEELQHNIDTSSAEHMADTLRNIGASISTRKDFATALKWLKRAFEVINHPPLEQLSVEGLDSRLLICQDLIQILLSMNNSESISEAEDLVAFIEGEIGDKPIVLHWRLEILQKSSNESSDPETYASILRRMICVFDETGQTFSFLLHHIQELRHKSLGLAGSLLDEFLSQQVMPSANREWLNRLVVCKVWLSTMVTGSSMTKATRELSELLSAVLDSIEEPLGAEVAGAAQSLIWNKIESTLAKQQLDISDKWCSVALHDIFSNCGDCNKAKFGRKRILCALGLDKPDEARLIYISMAEAAQNDVLTRYLMFKVALRTWDTVLGIECIGYLSEAAGSGKSQDMLYACIREAQQAGDKLCTVAALKAVAEEWDPVRSSASCLTSVLRCGIRLIALICDEVEQSGETGCPPTLVEDTCKLFEIASERAQKGEKDQEGNKMFTIPELNWFRKNAYNIGVTKCTSSSWELPEVIRIFTACLVFGQSYPSDIPNQDQQDLALMAMRCHFVIAAALVSVARAEDRIDEQLQRYLEMRQHIARFDTEMDNVAGEQTETVVKDLHQKFSTLLVFDFEGAVILKSWDDLPQIVRKAEICNDEPSLKAMGDCLLRSEAPGRVLFTTLRQIINQIHALSSFNSTHLCKYIRCLFQAILPLDSSLALQLLDQAIKIAHDGLDAGAPLPGVEMEWLIAKTFNHAVDHYSRGEERNCGKWAMKAIELAGWLDDGGEFKGVLEGKFTKLNFERK